VILDARDEMKDEGDAGLTRHWPMLCKINFEPMGDGACCFLVLAPPLFFGRLLFYFCS
jgi:hypothetical protein